jgi:uncharacterized protein YjbK
MSHIYKEIINKIHDKIKHVEEKATLYSYYLHGKDYDAKRKDYLATTIMMQNQPFDLSIEDNKEFYLLMGLVVRLYS